MKKVTLEFSRNNMEEIEKLAKFQPIYTYPKMSDVSPRSWGYITGNDIVYFLKVNNQEEKIEQMTDGFYQMKIRLAGIESLAKQGLIDLNKISEEMKPLIDLCQAMLCIFKKE